MNSFPGSHGEDFQKVLEGRLPTSSPSISSPQFAMAAPLVAGSDLSPWWAEMLLWYYSEFPLLLLANPVVVILFIKLSMFKLLCGSPAWTLTNTTYFNTNPISSECY